MSGKGRAEGADRQAVQTAPGTSAPAAVSTPTAHRGQDIADPWARKVPDGRAGNRVDAAHVEPIAVRTSGPTAAAWASLRIAVVSLTRARITDAFVTQCAKARRDHHIDALGPLGLTVRHHRDNHRADR